MFGGLNRPLAAAAVAVAVLVVPPAAFACGGGPSAVNVYKECLPSGSGGKSTGHGGGGGSSQNGGTSSTGSTSPISQQTKKVLAKAGQDRKSLANLVKGVGAARVLQSSSSPATEPSAVGSAFDVGSGPTALLIVLACTAILLFAATGYRTVRQRRR